jgi:hypothetical protein
MIYRKCKDCVYYRLTEERDREIGDCHRYPQVVKKYGSSFCGEYTAKSTEE